MLVAATTLCAAPAAAQDSRVFLNINFGYQVQSQDPIQSAEFPLYEETGTWQAQHSIGGGAPFEIGGGWNLSRRFGVGLSFATRAKDSRDVNVTANVPSPVFTDTLRNASASLTGLEHSERAVHLQALWQVPVTVEFDVTVFGGPTIFSVRDDVIQSVAPSELGGDFSSVGLDVSRTTQRKSTVGFNMGVDTRYRLTRLVGVGAMLRYSYGSVDLTLPDNPTGTLNVDAGGLEIGAGLRFRF